MVVESNKTRKYCSMYANDMHLAVMLIPYIEKELENGNKIITIFETDLENEINFVVKQVNLGKSKKNKIKNIKWNKNLLSEEQISEIRNKTILIKGSLEYIEDINKLVNGKRNKIVNCYDFEDFEKNSQTILETHEAILNTTGVKKIPEIFQVHKRLNSILTK